jgi:hypothetical protein
MSPQLKMKWIALFPITGLLAQGWFFSRVTNEPTRAS